MRERAPRSGIVNGMQGITEIRLLLNHSIVNRGLMFRDEL